MGFPGVLANGLCRPVKAGYAFGKRQRQYHHLVYSNKEALISQIQISLVPIYTDFSIKLHYFKGVFSNNVLLSKSPQCSLLRSYYVK